MGTTVVNGSGRAIVTATGVQTEIAQMPVDRAAESEIGRRSLMEANISKKALWFFGICISSSVILWTIITLLGIMPRFQSIVVSLGFLIALWPMGLIEAVTMALTVGMRRLSESGIIVRKFLGAESLANATVICSDKTGIMTQNRTAVKKVFVDGRIVDIEGDGYDPESGGFPPGAAEEHVDLPLLLTAAAMCTNTEVKNTPEGWSVIGDPTEGAQMVDAMKGSIDKDELELSLMKSAELPFDPERKRTSMVFKAPNDEFFVFTKGSLETVLDICNKIQLHGYVDNLDVGRQRAIWAVNQSFARSGMQSLAFAYYQLEDELEEYTIETVEQNLVFIGMIGMVDPPRSDTKQAITKCLAGSVEPIMLTDNYVNTAFSFAQELGIAKDVSEVLTGEELDILGDKEYSSLTERFSVYADISPAHRLRIIRTLKENGEVTALVSGQTGDETAIKAADVGIVSGQTCSSVAIDASDVVLMDESFASAVDAIEGMRAAYGNARKIIRYLLSELLCRSYLVGQVCCPFSICLYLRSFSGG